MLSASIPCQHFLVEFGAFWPEIQRQQFGLRATLRIFLPIFFPIRQRGHGDFRVFRIRPMHRLGIVPQRLLREPFGETTFQRPLRPRIPIAMQRYAGNPQSVTTLLELRRPIPGAHGANMRKQRPRCRTPFQPCFYFQFRQDSTKATKSSFWSTLIFSQTSRGIGNEKNCAMSRRKPATVTTS